jgi:hypothetical protein
MRLLPSLAAAAAALAGCGASALEDFAWLSSRATWTLNTPQYRSSAAKSNLHLFENAGAWVSGPGTDQWVVADLGVPMTVDALRVTATGEDNAPKAVELEAADAVEGPWRTVHRFVVLRQDAPQVFPSIGATARFFKLHVKTTWAAGAGAPKNVFLRKLDFLAGQPIQCGDQIAVRSVNNRRYFSGRGTHMIAPAGGETFSVYCEGRPGGTPLSYGDAIALRHVNSGRWVVDGGNDRTDADTPTVAELGRDTGKPDTEDGMFFWLFNPTSLDDRGLVERGAELALRNRFTQNLRVLDGQVLIRSAQYGAAVPDKRARFTLHAVEAFQETGCADGSREAFTSLSKYPNIAGCAARWGNSLGTCPAGHLGTDDGQYGCSACASGWHLCGSGGEMGGDTCNAVNSGGDAAEVSRHVCYSDCKAQPGVFATAVSHASKSVSPPRAGSGHHCSICSADVETLGCGSRTFGAKASGASCGSFPALMAKSHASPDIPMPISCAGNTRCLATPFKCCDANDSKGTQGNWRGVLCCKNNVFATAKKC